METGARKERSNVNVDDDVNRSEHFFVSVQRCIEAINRAIEERRRKLMEDFVPTCRALNSLINNIRSLVNKDILASDKLLTTNLIGLLGLNRQQNESEYEAFDLKELETSVPEHIASLRQQHTKLGEWVQALRTQLIGKLSDEEIESVCKEFLNLLTPFKEMKFGCGGRAVLCELYGGNCASIVRLLFISHLHIENADAKVKYARLIELLAGTTSPETVWDTIKSHVNGSGNSPHIYIFIKILTHCLPQLIEYQRPKKFLA